MNLLHMSSSVAKTYKMVPSEVCDSEDVAQRIQISLYPRREVVGFITEHVADGQAV